VFHDVNSGGVHVPLQTLPQAKAAFEIHNSPLTENALVGFEYGYNIQEPSRLVIWEAQYGDFINGAQTMGLRIRSRRHAALPVRWRRQSRWSGFAR